MKLPDLGDIFKNHHKVVLVPDYYFYTELIQLPEGIEAGDISNFAEYTMEEISPFPLDQLCWGFLAKHESASNALLYAAFKPRLKADGILDIKKAYHVLPAFISHSGLDVAEPTRFLCQYEDSLSALHFVPGQIFPAKVESLQFNDADSLEDEEENAIEENVFQASQKLIDEESSEQASILTCVDAQLDDEVLVFSHVYQPSEDEEIQVLPDNYVSGNEFLWNADIRDSHFKHTEIKKRKFGQYSWIAMQSAAVAAMLLVCMQLFNFGGSALLQKRHQKIIRDNDAVTAVIEQEKSRDTLMQFENAELQPFAMLGTLNKDRPNDLYFKSARCESGSPLIIRGQATSLAALESYTSKVKADPNIKSAEVTRAPMKSGKVDFTLNVAFESFDKEDDALAFTKTVNGK